MLHGFGREGAQHVHQFLLAGHHLLNILVGYWGFAEAAAQPLALLPNPGLTTTLPLPAAGCCTVQVRDLAGRLVLASATGHVARDGAALAAGVYVVEARAGTGALWRGRWVRP